VVHFDWWTIPIPIPVALALVAAIGYFVGRWRRASPDDAMLRSRRELKRAQAVAAELERITWTVSQSLARHQASVTKFKDRVARLNDQQEGAAWKDLCREAESILKPTLQLATQIAGAYDEIRQQSSHLMTFTEARTDPLTSVFNRRGLDDAIRTHLALMGRYHTTFSLAMFDIDHFKQINDRQGHVHGDRTLQQLANLFEEFVRDTDVVARYGGEEFVIVMPQTDLAGACTFSERLRSQVADQLSITISGGVTVAVDGDTPESLVTRADMALYQAKNAGRNCVFCRVAEDAQPVTPDKSLPQNLAWPVPVQQTAASAPLSN
jgi:diguanylate cyclase